jgi:transcription elongation factor GreA-like protein
MKLWWRFAIVILTIVAGSLVLAACGGGDGEEEQEEEISLEDYFQQFDAIEEGMKTESAALDEQSEGIIGQDVQATQDYVTAYYDIVEQGLNDVKALQAPSEVKDAQDEFVAALANMISLWDDLSDRLAAITTSEELQTLLMEIQAETEWVEVSQQFTDACRELQGIADENGIAVTLDCE